MAHRRAAQSMLRAMFDGYMARSDLMTASFRQRVAHEGMPRSVADYWRTLAAAEYWKREVTDKVKVSEEEIESAYGTWTRRS